MTIEDAYRQITARPAAIVYLTGKTCTGKTTFANRLAQGFGYEIIQLDHVVHDAVIQPLGLKDRGSTFVSVYKTADQPEWVQRFVDEAQRRINALLARRKKIAIDGAVPNLDVARQLLHGLPHVQTVFFHATPNSATYIRNLTARFIDATLENGNGLPKNFWQYIDTAAFHQFCQDKLLTPALQTSIHAYATYSTQNSAERLQECQRAFPHLLIAEI